MLWAGDRLDQRALAERDDWSELQGLEGLWPILARRHGEAIALDAPHAHPPEQVSFQDLDARIQAAAAAFVALGLREGDVVALFAENSPRWLVADQGIMRSGAADAVRGGSAPPEELRYILDDSAAVGLVVETSGLLDRLALQSDVLSRLRFVVLLEDGPSAGEDSPQVPGPRRLSWQTFQALGRGEPAAAPPSAGPERLATLLYTSGTTGQPEGGPPEPRQPAAPAAHPGGGGGSAPGRSGAQCAAHLACLRAHGGVFPALLWLPPDLHHPQATQEGSAAVRPQYLISVPRLWEAILSGFEDALAAMPPSRQRLLGVALANSRSLWAQLPSSPSISPSPRGTAAARLAAGAGGCRALAPPSIGLRPAVAEGAEPVGGRGACARRSAAAVPWRCMWTAFSRRSASSCWWATASRKPARCSPAVGPGATVAAAPANRCRNGTEDRESRDRRGAVLAAAGGGAGPGAPGDGRLLHKPEATAKVLDADGWFDTGDLGRCWRMDPWCSPAGSRTRSC
jgi:long-chain acyl-CoA synthetase